MKKILIFLAVILCLTLAFVACDNNDEPTETPTTAPTEAPTTAPTEAPTQAPTEAPTEEPTEAPVVGVEYKVVVKDENGTPVKGVSVQICKDDLCMTPVKTDANGVATFELEEYEGYKAKVLKAEGYEFSTEYTYFANGATELTLKVTTVAEECDHVEVTIPAVAATCTEAGLTAGVKCSVCNEVLTAQEVVPAAHTEAPIAAVAATCSETGLTAGVKCSVCDEIITAQQTVPTIPHTEEIIPGTTATCTKDGLSEGLKCTVCGQILVKQEVAVEAPGHSYPTIYDNVCTVCGDTKTAPVLKAKAYQHFRIGTADNAFADFAPISSNIAVVDSANAETGAVNFTKLFSGVRISLVGYAGYDKSITCFGYYIDGDTSNMVTVEGQRASNEIRKIAGNKAEEYVVTVDTKVMGNGEHVITFFVKTSGDVYTKLTDWNVNVVERQNDPTKPTANVIIVSGQSNAYGASPINNSIKAKYENKTFNNVYIHYNNINIDLNDNGGTWKTLFSNADFEQYRLGIGAQSTTYLGPELGIIDYLCENGYTDDAPLYVIKFTAAGTYLNGQWFPTTLTHYGEFLDPYGLVGDMGDYLYNQMADYIYESLTMIPEDYNINIQSFFWVQGESDAGLPDVADIYGEYEQLLVGSIRSEFAKYAAPDGISFVNYAIAENAEGNVDKPNGINGIDYVDWVYAESINANKKANCGYWYDPNSLSENDGQLIKNENTPFIENSYLVFADILRSKATAGDNEANGTPSADFAHMCGDDMILLGKWMGAGMLYLENLNNAE